MSGYFIEITDTFGGQANYSWVEKHYVEADEKNVVRRAKNMIGWNGVRCNRYDHGDMIELRPRHQAVVAFIQRETWLSRLRGAAAQTTLQCHQQLTVLKFSDYRIPVYLTKEETESVSAQLKNIIRQYKESIAELKEPTLVSAAEQSISYYEQLQLEFLKAIDEHLKINVKHSAWSQLLQIPQPSEGWTDDQVQALRKWQRTPTEPINSVELQARVKRLESSRGASLLPRGKPCGLTDKPRRDGELKFGREIYVK